MARVKVEREETKAKRDSHRKISWYIARAQAAFNEFVRLRDHDKPCVSCGITNPPMKHGGAWDAGHFLSRGAHPELRFEPDNCHKQCKSCNGNKHEGKKESIRQAYEAELRNNRIGNDRVDWLKGPHPVPKLTREYLTEVWETYRDACKQLKKERDASESHHS